MVRLGMDLGFFPKDQQRIIDLLLMEIQPAHLQIEAHRKLGAEERDQLRAEIMRRRLKTLPEPDIVEEDLSGSPPDGPSPL
jgi:protein arginine kinase